MKMEKKPEEKKEGKKERETSTEASGGKKGEDMRKREPNPPNPPHNPHTCTDIVIVLEVTGLNFQNPQCVGRVRKTPTSAPPRPDPCPPDPCPPPCETFKI